MNENIMGITGEENEMNENITNLTEENSGSEENVSGLEAEAGEAAESFEGAATDAIEGAEGAAGESAAGLEAEAGEAAESFEGAATDAIEGAEGAAGESATGLEAEAGEAAGDGETAEAGETDETSYGQDTEIFAAGAAEEGEAGETGFGGLTAEESAEAGRLVNLIVENVGKEIIGKREAVELVLTALLTQGHVLLEDVPGVGKTSLVSSIAKSIDCGFKRIQFTPDLMPSDVTGFSVYNQKTGDFEFRQGAVMSNLVLADEINRASAKTQASLLEAMEEKQVTVDSVTYKLEPPFMVMATQNPIESFGTYPLPEAQIDRFVLKLKMGYPTVDEERVIIHERTGEREPLSAVVSREDILWLVQAASRVYTDEEIERYIVELVAATRTNSKVTLGSSPRGSIALNRTAKVRALFEGRGYVIPDDVKYMAPFVLGHRLILNHEAKAQRITPDQIIKEILDSVVAPGAK